MIERRLAIINKLGLHARAAAKLVALASQFGCEIELDKNGNKVNAKSIMGVMTLAAAKGSELTLTTDGEDAERAAAAIEELVADRFGEGE